MDCRVWASIVWCPKCIIMYYCCFYNASKTKCGYFLYKFLPLLKFSRKIIIADFFKLSFACVLITFFTLSLDYNRYIYIYVTFEFMLAYVSFNLTKKTKAK